MRLESKKDVEEYFSGDRIQCLICGKWYKALVSHITMHGISVDEYRDRFNIPWGRGLVSQLTKEKQAIALKTRYANNDKSLRPIHEIMYLSPLKLGRKQKHYEIRRVTVVKDYLRSLSIKC